MQERVVGASGGAVDLDEFADTDAAGVGPPKMFHGFGRGDTLGVEHGGLRQDRDADFHGR